MDFLWWKPKKGSLIQTAKNSEKSKLKILLEKRADVNEKDIEGTTALMAATFYGNADTVKLLLENNAKVNARAGQNETSLILAGNVDTAKILLKKNKGATAGR